MPSRTSAARPQRPSSSSAELLDEAGVATVAGTSFGRYGEGYLRLSYANSIENIREAIARMGAFLSNVKPVAA